MDSERTLRGIGRDLLLYGFFWIILTGGDFYQWWLGLMFVGLAVALRLAFADRGASPIPLRVGPLLSLMATFLYQSFKGGYVVATAALSPRRKVKPFYVSVDFGIHADAAIARLVYTTSICLFPGSVVCRIDEKSFVLHVLDEGMLDLSDLMSYEAKVFAAFKPAGR